MSKENRPTEKILVVEDSQVQANVLKAIMQEKYDVKCVYTAKDGVSEMSTGEYSLIILDVILPDRNGLDVLVDVQENVSLRNTPVIIITSLTDNGLEEKGLNLGAVDFITKPFNPVVVLARVAVHIRLHRYAKKLEELTMNDQLTGIGNRRYFDTGSVEFWNRCARSNSAMSISMFDIDNFKTYNDTFGHPEGDKVIAAIARVLRDSFRRCTDLVARYGGEEFVVIMTDGNASKDFEYVCTVRERIAKLYIEHNPIKQPFVTVSVGGVTVYPRRNEDVSGFLKIADIALYKAKEQGRDRVIWTSDRAEEWREKEAVV